MSGSERGDDHRKGSDNDNLRVRKRVGLEDRRRNRCRGRGTLEEWEDGRTDIACRGRDRKSVV